MPRFLVTLTFTSRIVGEVTIVSCAGRIVGGEETAALEAHLDALMAVNPHILLHLGSVDFIDSAGFGLLVRYLARVQNAAGVLRICAVSPTVDRALTVTRLKPVLQPFDTEGHAIADAHRYDDSFAAPDVLCVDESEDVLGYLRQLLRTHGHRATTASNLPDALILLKATRPRVVIVGAAIRDATGTRAADEFRRLIEGRTVIDLPATFGHQDIGDAAQHVLSAIARTR